MTHTYRQLTGPELCTFFVKITGGYLNKARDVRMLHNFMQTQELGSSEMLCAMFDTQAKDIPSLLSSREIESVLNEDPYQSETRLVSYLAGKPMPSFAIAYFDLIDTGVVSAEIENYFQSVSEQLKEYLEEHLDKPASLRMAVRK